MGKKDKNKGKNKDKKKFLKNGTATENLKSKCCEKYKKGEDKRCKRCPRFDLRKKADSLPIPMKLYTNLFQYKLNSFLMMLSVVKNRQIFLVVFHFFSHRFPFEFEPNCRVNYPIQNCIGY